MSSRTLERLDELATELERKGDDALRLDLVQRARRFKRSWIDMAQALVHVRKTRAYARWGYKDLYAYAEEELQLKRATVDKLTGSYMTIEQHAPEVLARDGVAQEIPNVDSVDYLARALGVGPYGERPRERRAEPPPRDVVDDMRVAVFQENEPAAVLRRRFNPILHPKPEGTAKVDAIDKSIAAARRLAAALPMVDELSDTRRDQVNRALEGLLGELEELRQSAMDALEREEQRAAK